MATLKSLVDETTNIKNELKTCHANLKNNLSAKGIEVSSEDKLGALVDKIPNIKGYTLTNVDTGNTLTFGTYKKTLTTYSSGKGTHKEFVFDRIMKGFYNVSVYGTRYNGTIDKSYVSIVLDGVEIGKINFSTNNSAYTEVYQFETVDIKKNSSLKINYVGEGVGKSVSIGDCSITAFVKEI